MQRQAQIAADRKRYLQTTFKCRFPGQNNIPGKRNKKDPGQNQQLSGPQKESRAFARLPGKCGYGLYFSETGIEQQTVKLKNNQYDRQNFCKTVVQNQYDGGIKKNAVDKIAYSENEKYSAVL